MQVKRFVVNPLGVNCYVVYHQGEAVIVDPGEASEEILEFIQQENLQVVAIINTHGHADHIAGNGWIMEKTKAPLWIHELEAPYLSDPNLHLGPMIGQEFPPVEAQRLLKAGDIITLGDKNLEVLHTPGHSPGGIALYGAGFLISGDTLFKSSVGRWDLPQGDQAVLQQSLARLALLPPETVVYPGHGSSTTIQDEVESNPFF
jgi:glyoxylase-like metal-dependent hydrolase (beta-lactamase superfamily II)